MTDRPNTQPGRWREFVHWILDRPLVFRLWLLDRIAGPLPETEVDQIEEQQKQRLRQAFPGVDVDGTGPAGSAPRSFFRRH